MKKMSRKGKMALQGRDMLGEMSQQLQLVALDEESARRVEGNDNRIPVDDELSDPERAEIYHDSGDDKIAGGDYQGALDDLCEAIGLDPQNGRHYSHRGVAHYELGRYDEAIEDESKSIEICPTPNTLYNRAEAYYKTGRDNEALDDLDRAMKLAREMPGHEIIIPEIEKLVGIIKDKSVSAKDYYQPPIGFGRETSSAEPDREELDDVGPEVLRFIYITGMRIDERWSLKTERGFIWWGHKLAQRVWADECRTDDGVDVTLMHVETDLLRNVENNARTHEALNDLNAGTSLFAFIYDPKNLIIGLHSTVYTHRQSLEWSKRLFLRAVGLQVSYAHKMAEKLSCLFPGSEPDTSPHPNNGFRPEGDELVNLINNFYIPVGEKMPAIGSETFKFTEDNIGSRFMITTGRGFLTAEFPFTGEEPVCVRIAQGKPGVVTSLFRVNSTEGHPLLGKGLMMRMTLPVSCGSRKQALFYAMTLNLLEATHWIKCHLNGAWCVDEQPNLVFVSFCPAAELKNYELVNFSMSCAIRSKWAAEVFFNGEADHPGGVKRMLH